MTWRRRLRSQRKPHGQLTVVRLLAPTFFSSSNLLLPLQKCTQKSWAIYGRKSRNWRTMTGCIRRKEWDFELGGSFFLSSFLLLSSSFFFLFFLLLRHWRKQKFRKGYTGTIPLTVLNQSSSRLHQRQRGPPGWPCWPAPRQSWLPCG